MIQEDTFFQRRLHTRVHFFKEDYIHNFTVRIIHTRRHVFSKKITNTFFLTKQRKKIYIVVGFEGQSTRCREERRENLPRQGDVAKRNVRARLALLTDISRREQASHAKASLARTFRERHKFSLPTSLAPHLFIAISRASLARTFFLHKFSFFQRLSFHTVCQSVHTWRHF